MTKDEQSKRLVHLATQLLMTVQGCTNHGCFFNEIPEGMVGTNAICQCKAKAEGIVGAITDTLDVTTLRGASE